jgi:hypothetical protein
MACEVRVRCRCYALSFMEVGMTQDPDPDEASTPVPGTPMPGAPVTSVPIPWPALSGPGSDTEAWVAFAREVAKGTEEAQEVLDEQAALIASLEGELAQLQAQLVERGPAETQATAPQPDTPRPSTLEPGTLEPAGG